MRAEHGNELIVMTNRHRAQDIEREAATRLPLNPRDFLILFALVEGERHGYAILKQVEGESSGQVRLDPANLYRSLRRLMKEGLVTESEKRAAPDLDDERRRYYALSELGASVVVAEAVRLSRLMDAARARNLIPET